jgi:sensor histidine kinase regulating citrate/malate metabolism
MKLCDSLEIKRNNDIYRLELDLYREHIKEKENAMTEFRKNRHDLKYKLIALKNHVRNSTREEIERYIDELIDIKATDKFFHIDTGNILLDTLLNFKYEMAEKQGINFNINAQVPYNLPFDNDDLCIILGNAIDNAIEANAYTTGEVPYIDLKIKYQDKNLIIDIKNSFDGNIVQDKAGKLISRKKDSENHGMGINSIKRSLQKYNGYMDIKIDGSMYQMKLIMYSPQENPD